MNKLEQFIVDNNLGQFDPEPFSGNAIYDAAVPGDAMQLAGKILDLSPMSERFRNVVLTGYDREIVADTEFGSGQTGLTTLRAGYVINHAIRLARRSLSGDERVEVGLKYPQFDIHRFSRKFKLTGRIKVLNTLALADPKEEEYRNEENYRPYDMFIDPKGNVYTFERNRIGEGGYAGAVFVNEAEAFKFIDWFLGDSTHYLKDLDVGLNCLGGYGIKDLEKLEPYPTKRALWKELTKKERAHLREMGITSLREFKAVAAKQAETRAKYPTYSELCWECRYIATRFHLSL